MVQGKTKVEESAPGAATGMILSLRERYTKIVVFAFRATRIIYIVCLEHGTDFSPHPEVCRTVKIILRHVRFVLPHHLCCSHFCSECRHAILLILILSCLVVVL